MIKRLFDITLALLLLIVFSPVFLICMVAIWSYDRHSPFYVAPRVGKGGHLFNMIKFRSMVIHADKSGVDSTSANDRRITPIGSFIRKYKIDELSQIFNVILGDMSFVGPRPNVKRETDLYTEEEQRILDVKPGITDLASIVFADEGDILKDSQDPDLDYNQLIRPWKSRLAILYCNHQSLLLDLKLLWLTFICILDRSKALQQIQTILDDLKADAALKNVAQRTHPLVPTPPPGMDSIVTSRSS
jgi:lipopolysaccharide/colanic/teichoic acid biosynthesis glycosyltransferase